MKKGRPMAMGEMEGRRFGRLLVLGPSVDRERHWVCLCDCGDAKEVNVSNLLAGNTKSCGCLRREQATRRADVRRIGEEP